MKFNFDDLVARKLVQKKSYDNGSSVYKYTKRVFYDALWNEDSRILEARGIVLDAEGNVVIWPFTKVFNHGENNTTCDTDKEVIVVDKLNGFMAAATIYKGELLVSTTGTLDSEYVAMARKHIEKLNTNCMMDECTYIFEICDPDDPHIVEELAGAHLIGVRVNSAGIMFGEPFLDYEATLLGAWRPSWIRTSFGVACDMAKSTNGEGFMIRDVASGEHLMKIKSPHYLTKKALMRLGSRQIEVMFTEPEVFRQRLDEEFYSVYDHILEQGKDFWASKNEVERREFLENYFKGDIV